jgi:hypothetical protein
MNDSHFEVIAFNKVVLKKLLEDCRKIFGNECVSNISKDKSGKSSYSTECYYFVVRNNGYISADSFDDRIFFLMSIISDHNSISPFKYCCFLKKTGDKSESIQ